MNVQQIKLMRGDEEIPIEALVGKVFEKLKDAPESLTEEDKELFATGARMGMDFLSDFEELADPIKAMLYVAPQMASYMLAMFTGGMFLQRALANPNNNLSIHIEEVEESAINHQCSSPEGHADEAGGGCNASTDPDPSGRPSGESMGSSPGEDGQTE